MNTTDPDRRKFLKKGLIATVTLGAVNFFPFLSLAQPSAKKERDFFKQINRAKDPDKLQGVELGHVPRISAPDTIKPGVPFEVEVRVGEKLHEMIPTHYIDWIDLYADDIFLTKFILTPNFTQPICKMMLTLNKSATLRALEHCNLHGLWEGTKQVKIK